jgi:hypothetical protein
MQSQAVLLLTCYIRNTQLLQELVNIVVTSLADRPAQSKLSNAQRPVPMF